ncbi:bacterioferritin-associated ferredoxin [Novosphingobium sp. 9U]|uniref:(2Fe-2S)-binding protein n=1 Tax=Novosphingobium sp. 9U TaxID=2653158 RepID=UPI0012EF3B54|nr:(2Fe-2S)-binding protein [Novosphingobium sp. 9U]VWX47077.1 Ferredoxin [Novosphingobium sp. 9U]
MYVCICNAIRECELRQAARTCRGDAEALYTAIGRPPQCGQCVDEAEDIIADERLSTLLPVPLAAADRTLQPAHT